MNIQGLPARLVLEVDYGGVTIRRDLSDLTRLEGDTRWDSYNEIRIQMRGFNLACDEVAAGIDQAEFMWGLA